MSKIFKRIINAWKKTKYSEQWDVLYRKKTSGSILYDLKTPFEKINLPKNVYAADPLAVSIGDGNFLFFEMMSKKDKKGRIAYFYLNDLIYKNDIDPKIILKTGYHLSFPFVFTDKKCTYMLPETGAIKKIVLFDFDKNTITGSRVLLDNVLSADNIVFYHNEKYYLISSIKLNTPSECVNYCYLLNKEMDIVKQIEFKSDLTKTECRNAGPIFNLGGLLFRPSQYGTIIDYGKGLCFSKILFNNDYVTEEKYKTILVDDIVIKNPIHVYTGIHTYSSTSDFEFIDAKYNIRNSFITRVKIMIAGFKQYYKKKGSVV